MANLTLWADTDVVSNAARQPLAASYTVRSSTPDDVAQIGSLYFSSYGVGEACATEDEAVADVAASFDGDYGEYLHVASPVIEADSAVVAAIMTIRRAPWDDTPDCPFVIELFTHPDHRRRGLATTLLGAAAAEISHTDSNMALRVEDQNSPALALYQKLGFRRWEVRGHP